MFQAGDDPRDGAPACAGAEMPQGNAARDAGGILPRSFLNFFLN